VSEARYPAFFSHLVGSITAIKKDLPTLFLLLKVDEIKEKQAE
jgi:hypothetical protein